MIGNLLHHTVEYGVMIFIANYKEMSGYLLFLTKVHSKLQSNGAAKRQHSMYIQILIDYQFTDCNNTRAVNK